MFVGQHRGSYSCEYVADGGVTPHPPRPSVVVEHVGYVSTESTPIKIAGSTNINTESGRIVEARNMFLAIHSKKVQPCIFFLSFFSFLQDFKM